MSKKLYVASLPFSVNSDEELAKIFGAIGTVASVKIITDATTGKGKGIGFVEMETEEDAALAISQLNGSTYGGRKILVSEARSEIKSKQEDAGALEADDDSID
jgi:RNA recognition motif-containing protein